MPKAGPVSVLITVYIIVVHNTALNSSDNNIPSYPSDNHPSSDDIYWRDGVCISAKQDIIVFRHSIPFQSNNSNTHCHDTTIRRHMFEVCRTERIIISRCRITEDLEVEYCTVRPIPLQQFEPTNVKRILRPLAHFTKTPLINRL